VTSDRRRRRLLITGAEGIIGTVLRERLAERFELRFLTRTPAPFESRVADISDLDAIAPAFSGIDSVIHLAASSAVESTWEELLPANIVGAYNVYEAAARSDVPQVVFASSNHAVGMYEVDGAPDIYEPGDPRCYDHTVEVRPDSLYGVSKAFGEALGRYYTERRGLRVICLRIGSIQPNDDPDRPARLEAAPEKPLTPEQERARTRALWLSHADCARLVTAAVEADAVRFGIVYGISDDPGRFFDLEHARRLIGYVPFDRPPDRDAGG
jgi:nucleoside-diphosphate-sugar epimerase